MRVEKAEVKAEPPSYSQREAESKGYLESLELKESIHVEDRKPMKQVEVPKKVEIPSILDKKLTQSIKESVNFEDSGEFKFDF